MPNHSIKPNPSGAPSSASAPRYVDDRTLERETGGVLRRATLQKMRRNPKADGPPHYKIGCRCYYRLDEVLAWIEAHRVATSSAGSAP